MFTARYGLSLQTDFSLISVSKALCPSYNCARYRGMNKLNRKCAYNAILRHVCESFLPWKSNKYYMVLCVCARARVCACAYVHVVLLIQHSCRMRHIVMHLWLPLFRHIFLHYLIYGTIFEKRLLNIKCVF